MEYLIYNCISILIYYIFFKFSFNYFQDNSVCNCKPQVDGRHCETCKIGSFNLEESNPAGCTKCFCFGKTSRCSSSALFWTQITIPKTNWTAVSINPNEIESSGVIGYPVEFESGSNPDSDAVSSFVPVYIPESAGPIMGNETNVGFFRGSLDGNFLASYGGYLTYTLVSDPDEASGIPIVFI